MSVRSVNRIRIQQIIAFVPGVHLRQLQRLLGISFHTVSYHIGVMSHNGDVLCRRDGKYTRLYPAGTNDKDRVTYSLMRRRASRRVLDVLLQMAKLNGKDIAAASGLAKSTVSEVLSELVRLEFVKVSLTANGIAYELQDADYVLNLRTRNDGLMNIATDRFVSLWDF